MNQNLLDSIKNEIKSRNINEIFTIIKISETFSKNFVFFRILNFSKEQTFFVFVSKEFEVSIISSNSLKPIIQKTINFGQVQNVFTLSNSSFAITTNSSKIIIITFDGQNLTTTEINDSNSAFITLLDNANLFILYDSGDSDLYNLQDKTKTELWRFSEQLDSEKVTKVHYSKDTDNLIYLMGKLYIVNMSKFHMIPTSINSLENIIDFRVFNNKILAITSDLQSLYVIHINDKDYDPILITSTTMDIDHFDFQTENIIITTISDTIKIHFLDSGYKMSEEIESEESVQKLITLPSLELFILLMKNSDLLLCQLLKNESQKISLNMYQLPNILPSNIINIFNYSDYCFIAIDENGTISIFEAETDWQNIPFYKKTFTKKKFIK